MTAHAKTRLKARQACWKTLDKAIEVDKQTALN